MFADSALDELRVATEKLAHGPDPLGREVAGMFGALDAYLTAGGILPADWIHPHTVEVPR